MRVSELFAPGAHFARRLLHIGLGEERADHRDARKAGKKADREMFTAVCASCGKEAKVPFQPREDRPVYCSECFAKMKEER